MKIIIYIFLTCFLACNPLPKRDYKREIFFFLIVQNENLNSTIEKKVFDNLKILTGPTGQVEYRGLDHFDNENLNGIGKYNWQEAEDATLYTGKTLGALAWRYKKTKDKETEQLIEKYINYYVLIQDLRDGALGRNFVEEEAYQKFIECNKNGIVGSTLTNEPCGTMRYTGVWEYKNKSYRLRWDYSLDATSHSLVALYWVKNFVPSQKEKVINIATRLLSFYERNNWRITDNGILLRYGNHDPNINPVAKMNEVILRNLATDSKISLGVWSSIFNISRTYDGVIITVQDNNFFNHYMMIKAMHVLYDLDYPIETGLRNLISEVNNQDNKLAEAMDITLFGSNRLHIKDDRGFPLYNYHCKEDQKFEEIIPLAERVPYSKWGFSPFRKCITKKISNVPFQREPFVGVPLTTPILGLNSDFLEAYWLQK